MFVILFHLLPNELLKDNSNELLKIFRPGWIGVDLFFVLSGFLITTILLNTKEKPSYFSNFIVRRALRIFPLYFLFLSIFIFVLPTVFNEGFLKTNVFYINNQSWFWLYLSNWLFSINAAWPPSPYLGHFWSLAIEEQFYLFWPVIVFIFSSKTIRKICLSFIVILPFLRYLSLFSFEVNSIALYVNTFYRLDSLLAGAFLSTLFYEGKEVTTFLIKFIFLISILAFLIIFYLTQGYSELNPIVQVIGFSINLVMSGCLVYFARLGQTPLTKVLTNPMLLFLGKYSYGIYIFHIPVFFLSLGGYRRVMGTSIEHGGVSHLVLMSSIAFVVTLVISFFSYHLIESYFLKMKRFFN